MFDYLTTDFFLWLLVAAAAVAGVAAIGFPATRPYAKKYGWILIAVVAGLLALIYFRKGPESRVDRAKAQGKKIAAQNTAAVDVIVAHAQAQAAAADAELAARRIEDQQARALFERQLEVIGEITDSTSRREALIDLVNSQRKS